MKKTKYNADIDCYFYMGAMNKLGRFEGIVQGSSKSEIKKKIIKLGYKPFGVVIRRLRNKVLVQDKSGEWKWEKQDMTK